MVRRRDNDGKFTESVDDGDILHFFESGKRSFYSTQEVAEEFKVNRSQAHRRLTKLTEKGKLKKVKIGSRNLVWWRPRDVIVLLREDTGFTALDPEVDVASQGESRPEALERLSEAIRLHDREIPSSEDSDSLYEEIGLSTEELEDVDEPPWFDE